LFILPFFFSCYSGEETRGDGGDIMQHLPLTPFPLFDFSFLYSSAPAPPPSLPPLECLPGIFRSSSRMLVFLGITMTVRSSFRSVSRGCGFFRIPILSPAFFLFPPGPPVKAVRSVRSKHRSDFPLFSTSATSIPFFLLSFLTRSLVFFQAIKESLVSSEKLDRSSRGPPLVS